MRADYAAGVTPESGLFRGEAVERLIFGTAEPDMLHGALDTFCRETLGGSISRVLFRRTSVGATFGLELDDGRRVVVKAHQPRQSSDYLTAAARVQQQLAAVGFPCPTPLAGPAPLGDGLATVEELVDAGEFRDAHEPPVRRELARLLARLVELTSTLEPPPALAKTWSLWRADGLWPVTAHSPIFDFATTQSGAEWIDGLASEAKARIHDDVSELVVHTDWSGKHFRFDEHGRVTVVYDWDSLGVTTEPRAVGIAAATHTSNVELDVDGAPTPEEVAAFVDRYESARSARLSDRERESARAAAAYVVAYTARCEHALGLRGHFTAALARHRSAYLPS